MYTQPRPTPDGVDRHEEAQAVRMRACALSRKPLTTTPNGEAEDFAQVWPTNFTKGLPHDVNGIVDAAAFECFFAAINTPDRSFDVPLGPKGADGAHRPAGYTEGAASAAVNGYFNTIKGKKASARGWESPVSGHSYDLQGPDAGSVGMAPAPRLGSDELAGEMAENYAMALLRDTSFEQMRQGTPESDEIIASLNCMAWFRRDAPVFDWVQGTDISDHSAGRRAARFNKDETSLTAQSAFRGSTPGCMDGPYISQFLLIGNKGRTGFLQNSDAGRQDGAVLKSANLRQAFPSEDKKYVQSEIADGYIVYGAQRIDQRIEPQKAQLDYMTDWSSWLDVQNGADARGSDRFADGLRFITTPRDLATYVHFDALYQAYLNAALLMLTFDTGFDSGFPEPGGASRIDAGNAHTRTPFATFGGPHILTLVTESATRSLKAVRRQKYNHHLRARPEALGAVYSLAQSSSADALGAGAKEAALCNVAQLETAQVAGKDSLLKRVHDHNIAHTGGAASVPGAPDISANNHLLAMAFPEGSPMHPAYGAGHATVAGSCVTTLKIFFEMFKEDGSWEPQTFNWLGKDENGNPANPTLFAPAEDASRLQDVGNAADVTIMGELNKLAANISIGRNMAGVHFYSDYYDSLRMGERIAVGIMLEQLESYGEAMQCRFISFDGDRMILKTDGTAGSTELLIAQEEGAPTKVGDDWWERHVPAAPAPAQADTIA